MPKESEHGFPYDGIFSIRIPESDEDISKEEKTRQCLSYKDFPYDRIFSIRIPENDEDISNRKDIPIP